eukprot:TRINITY_DN302_c3_g1_i1.p1 TRINITY_DN302_c3_g1~~TRINITY_DN302_c3_g1_i1.p1  ORF type:complete len:444 (+),score=127.01 TRINITY_DN302_c3_g1_i1:84-1334(+)
MGKSITILTAGKKDEAKMKVISAVGRMFGSKVESGEVDVCSEAYRQAVSCCGTSPAMHSPAGYVFGVNSIIRCLDEDAGRTAASSGRINSWLELAATEIDPVVDTLDKPTPQHSLRINNIIMGLNTWLECRTFLVDERLSVADIRISFAIINLYEHVLDQNTRKPYPHLNRWLDTVLNQKQLRGILTPVMCAKSPQWFKTTAKPTITKGSGKQQPQQQQQQQGKKDKQKNDAGAKKEKPAWKKEKQPPAPAKTLDGGDIDLRVGHIVEVKKHPNADSMYVEQIDVGEEKPREICSGLVKHMSAEALNGKNVIVMCNLKPAPLRGIVSAGMVMCSTDADGNVALVTAPAGAVAGDKLSLAKYDKEGDKVNPIPKKQVDPLLAELHTNEKGNCCWKDDEFVVKGKGNCASPHVNAKVR